MPLWNDKKSAEEVLHAQLKLCLQLGSGKEIQPPAHAAYGGLLIDRPAGRQILKGQPDSARDCDLFRCAPSWFCSGEKFSQFDAHHLSIRAERGLPLLLYSLPDPDHRRS